MSIRRRIKEVVTRLEESANRGETAKTTVFSAVETNPEPLYGEWNPRLLKLVRQVLQRAGEKIEITQSCDLRPRHFTEYLLPQVIVPHLRDEEIPVLAYLLGLEAKRYAQLLAQLLTKPNHPDGKAMINRIQIGLAKWQRQLTAANSPAQKKVLHESRPGDFVDNEVRRLSQEPPPRGQKGVTQILRFADLKVGGWIIVVYGTLKITAIRTGRNNNRGLLTMADGTTMAFQIIDNEYARLYYFRPSDYHLRPYESERR